MEEHELETIRKFAALLAEENTHGVAPLAETVAREAVSLFNAHRAVGRAQERLYDLSNA